MLKRKTTEAAATITDHDRQAAELLEGLPSLDEYRRTSQPEHKPAAPAARPKPGPEYPFGLPPIDRAERRVVGACGICGQKSKPPPESTSSFQYPSSFQGPRYPKGLRVRGVEFGLPQIKGETDFVRIETCKPCTDAWEAGGDYFYERGGLPANAGYAASKRLRDPKLGRAALLDWLPPNEIISADRLAEYTFAGATIKARMEGRPGPEPSETPFGWIEDAKMVNAMKYRKKEKR